MENFILSLWSHIWFHNALWPSWSQKVCYLNWSVWVNLEVVCLNIKDIEKGKNKPYVQHTCTLAHTRTPLGKLSRFNVLRLSSEKFIGHPCASTWKAKLRLSFFEKSKRNCISIYHKLFQVQFFVTINKILSLGSKCLYAL